MPEHMWTEVDWCRLAQQNHTLLLIMPLGAERYDNAPSLSKPTKREENLQHTMLVRVKRHDNERRQARVRSCRWPPQVRCCICDASFVPNHMQVQVGWPYMHVQCSAVQAPLLHRAVSNSERLTSKQHGGANQNPWRDVSAEPITKTEWLPTCRI